MHPKPMFQTHHRETGTQNQTVLLAESPPAYKELLCKLVKGAPLGWCRIQLIALCKENLCLFLGT